MRTIHGNNIGHSETRFRLRAANGGERLSRRAATGLCSAAWSPISPRAGRRNVRGSGLRPFVALVAAELEKAIEARPFDVSIRAITQLDEAVLLILADHLCPDV
jgi:hypothetical protein